MSARVKSQHIPLLMTTAVCVLLYAVGCLRYHGFLSARVLVNFFGDNAFLGIAAIGMTFVILSGGIDLSVGAVIGFTSIFVATLINRQHLHPMPVVLAALAVGAMFGAALGGLIHFFRLPPFLVTLAGMFLARGAGFVISLESMPINNPLVSAATRFGIPLGGNVAVPLTAVIFGGVVLVGIYVAQFTKFGRHTYAIGGNEQSAVLMGLPVGRTKLLVYTLSGFSSALAGIVYTLYTQSGNASAAVGLELDVIAAVVIGGTLLTGGVGYVAGTLIGVLILGIIQTAITFEGTLSSWWTKIAIGLLLFVFISLQKFLSKASTVRSQA